MYYYVVRSGLAYSMQEWDTNWDFREPKHSRHSRNWTEPSSHDVHHVRSLKEHSGDVPEQKESSHKPRAARHLVFIRHGQYEKGKEDKDKILTALGRFVLLISSFQVCFIWSGLVQSISSKPPSLALDLVVNYVLIYLFFYQRQQAKETAKRLKQLHSKKMKIDKVVTSTMTRATETAGLILGELTDVPYEYCDFLREGVPCRPVPPSKVIPEDHVRIYT